MSANLLPLETFRRILGWNPWHFWQLANQKIPLTSSCDTLVRQSAWQFADSAGRDEVVEAIALAEAKLTKHLGYPPGPQWFKDTVELASPQIAPNLAWPTPYYVGGKLTQGMVRALGVPTQTLLGTAAVTLDDKDGDGLKETFEATLTNSSVQDLTQLGLYFSSGDWVWWDSADMSDYAIRPVVFTRPNPTTLKVTGPAWLIVKPTIYQGVGNQPGYDNGQIGLDSSGSIDPDTVTNFVDSVDFYQTVVATADLGKGTLNYTDASGNPASYQLTLQLFNSQTGQFVNHPFCNSTWPWPPFQWGCCSTLDPVRTLSVNYQAGDELGNWAIIITRLALAELARPLSGCEEANRQARRWQQDAARAAGTLEEQFRISNSDLDNPIGTLWGHIQAWRRIKEYRLQRGIAL
jgi:hypothetical protein